MGYVTQTIFSNLPLHQTNIFSLIFSHHFNTDGSLRKFCLFFYMKVFDVSANHMSSVPDSNIGLLVRGSIQTVRRI